jgi:hypothetical protein
MSWGVRFIILAAVSSAISAVQAPTFTGFWKLNVAKSTWGKKQVPAVVMVEIDHKEPVLKYSGDVVDVHGDGRHFEFAGATDGRECPSVRAGREGNVVLERRGPYEILATFRSNDGVVVERARMTLSRDGKVLVYDIRVTDPGGDMRWTEVYEKQ